MSENASIHFQLLPARRGYKIGVVTLDRPQRLNAMDLAMVKQLRQRLARWRRSPRIAAVVIRAAGKHFCCGGDIRSLYDSIQDTSEDQYELADEFFREEYRNNAELHRFGKPLITLGQGLIMGGGIGLFLGGCHRVIDKDSQMAWPEIKIGLFPDVLGSWFLARLTPGLGLWMGLTGQPLNATDTRQQALAHQVISVNRWDDLVNGLCRLDWSDQSATNQKLTREYLASMDLDGDEDMPVSCWNPVSNEVSLMVAAFEQQWTLPVRHPDPWVQAGLDAFHRGCPATARLVPEQLRLGRQLSKYEAAKMELGLAWKACRFPDLAEGIRALLVDKDKQPNWQHSDVASVPASYIEEWLKSPWSADQHPLRSLQTYAKQVHTRPGWRHALTSQSEE